MKRILESLFISVIVVMFSSCNIDEDITTILPPKITLDSENGIYTVKTGREITIAPSYESVQGATYCWTMNGEVLATTPSLTFMRETIGEYFITISVRNDGGITEEEIRVDVVDLEIPNTKIKLY